MVQYMDNNSGFNQWNANKNATAKRSSFSGFLWWFLIFLTAWWLVGTVSAPKQNNQTVTEDATVIDMSDVPQYTIDTEKINASVQGLRISNIKLSEFFFIDSSLVAAFNFFKLF